MLYLKPSKHNAISSSLCFLAGQIAKNRKNAICPTCRMNRHFLLFRLAGRIATALKEMGKCTSK